MENLHSHQELFFLLSSVFHLHSSFFRQKHDGKSSFFIWWKTSFFSQKHDKAYNSIHNTQKKTKRKEKKRTYHIACCWTRCSGDNASTVLAFHCQKQSSHKGPVKGHCHPIFTQHVHTFQSFLVHPTCMNSYFTVGGISMRLQIQLYTTVC